MLADSDKDRFVAKYGDIDLDKEFSPENPNPNVHAIRRPEATRKHALMLLNHPNEDAAVFALSMTNQKTRMLKRSDLENYSGGSAHVKQQIDNLFKYESMVNKPGADRSALRRAMKIHSFKPFYPEDKE